MAVYRFARQEEEDEILDLINLVFSQTARPHDFSEMLPKVYAYPGFSRYHAVAEEGGRLIATIATNYLFKGLVFNWAQASFAPDDADMVKVIAKTKLFAKVAKDSTMLSMFLKKSR